MHSSGGTMLFRYRARGRSVRNLLVLGVSVALFTLGAVFAAPAVWFVPVGLAVALLLVTVVRDPLRGVDLTGDELVLVTGDSRTSYPYALVDSVVTTVWSDSEDVVLCLRGGERVALPTTHLPPSAVLRRELSLRGVHVEER